MDPELILGFRRDGDELVVISPDGKTRSYVRGELFDEVKRRLVTDGQPQVVSAPAEVTEDQLRSAYGVLYDFVRTRAAAEVGHEVVSAAETVARKAHSKAEDALKSAPRGPSRKFKLLQQRRAARGGGS